MKMKRKSAKVYAIRRRIAEIYIVLSTCIGFPMAIIGTGGDFGTFIPFLYFTGLILVLTGCGLIHVLIHAFDK